jgi:hypothetical protein
MTDFRKRAAIALFVLIPLATVIRPTPPPTAAELAAQAEAQAEAQAKRDRILEHDRRFHALADAIQYVIDHPGEVIANEIMNR